LLQFDFINRQHIIGADAKRMMREPEHWGEQSV
jgi:hypothetical protein